jgi:hypothetical protein
MAGKAASMTETTIVAAKYTNVFDDIDAPPFHSKDFRFNEV